MVGQGTAPFKQFLDMMKITIDEVDDTFHAC